MDYQNIISDVTDGSADKSFYSLSAPAALYKTTLYKASTMTNTILETAVAVMSVTALYTKVRNCSFR
jgi:hypothetical protein